MHDCVPNELQIIVIILRNYFKEVINDIMIAKLYGGSGSHIFGCLIHDYTHVNVGDMNCTTYRLVT